MKSVQVELSDKVIGELDRLGKNGCFRNEEEAIRLAVIEFLSQRRLDLMERFEREDIAWALRQKQAQQQ